VPVVDGGVLKDKKGMNLPGSALSVPALTEKDKKDLCSAASWVWTGSPCPLCGPRRT